MASDFVTDKEVRIVLIGFTGSGKSASANTILGEKRFHSKARLTSTTTTCKVEHKSRFGHDIVIVDTPGAFDTKLSQGEITREIIQCIPMSSPGPHAFIMVLQAKRFTPEEQKTIEHIEDIFGERIYDYMFLLFTRIDDLEEDGQNLEEILNEAPENLKHLIDKCGRRYVGFNNREKDETKKDEMARRLIDMIKVNVNRNGGRYYTSALLEAAEKEVEKRQEKKKIENDIIRKVKKEIKKEVREQLIKIEKEREQMKKDVRQEMITEVRKVREELIKIEKEREQMKKDVRQEMITEVRKVREELIKIEIEREEMKKEVRQEMITEVRKVREELTKIEKEREEMKKDVRQEMITEVGKVREEVTRKIDKENEKQTEAIKSLERPVSTAGLPNQWTCTDSSITDNKKNKIKTSLAKRH